MRDFTRELYAGYAVKREHRVIKFVISVMQICRISPLVSISDRRPSLKKGYRRNPFPQKRMLISSLMAFRI